MTRFLALFVGAPDAFAKWNAQDDDTRKVLEAEAKRGWAEWREKHKSIVVDDGGSLGKTKRADVNGVSDSANDIGGYLIVETETHDDAARLFERHPHLTIMPGNAVEIMPLNPISM